MKIVALIGSDYLTLQLVITHHVSKDVSIKIYYLGIFKDILWTYDLLQGFLTKMSYEDEDLSDAKYS